MSDAKAQLMELEEGLRSIASHLDESTDAISLAHLRENLLDTQMQIRGVIEQDPTTRDVAEDLLHAAKDLRTAVTAQMEALTDNALDAAVSRAVSGGLNESQDGDLSLRDLLRETKSRLDYYRSLAEDLSADTDSVTRREFEAAKALAEGLLSKCKELQEENGQLLETLEEAVEHASLNESVEDSHEYAELAARYDKALMIIEELTERIRGAQVADRVEEVIRMEPRFARIRDDLLECQTVEEVNERVGRLGRLLEGEDFVADDHLYESYEDEDESIIDYNDFLQPGAFDFSPLNESSVEQAPVVQLNENQKHRMSLIQSLSGYGPFRK